MPTLAIIGGSGLNQIDDLDITASQAIETPYGCPSADYVLANVHGMQIVFLARHGNPHTIAPHKINYRANIWGLNALGVTEIIAVAAVGGITPAMSPTHIVLPDQIIDYSYGREHTFFAEALQPVTHIDFTTPYNQSLHTRLIQVAQQEKLPVSPHGTYACMQGPRLETSAEITRLERDGCDIVGMTAMPEAALAKEMGLHYATIAVITNWAAGKSADNITTAIIERYIKTGMVKAVDLLTAYIKSRV